MVAAAESSPWFFSFHGKGTIFARWFALGETGGRVQVDAARGVVGTRAPPLLPMPRSRRHLVSAREFVSAGSSRISTPGVARGSLLYPCT